jgi:hypothetical protein
MTTNSAQDWLALTAHYRSMSDGELIELADAFDDLTPTAQQVLADEMKLRKLGDPRDAGWNAPVEEVHEDAEARPGVEYTWKTPLCGCDDPVQAFQMVEVLRRAGIESWIDRSSRFTPLGDSDTGKCLLVAADQLDHARSVLAQPVPRDIVELSEMTEPEFEVPVCPRCGAPDPILESVDPVNVWLCESCEAEWEEEAELDEPEA